MSNDFLPMHLIQTFVAFMEAANITEAAEQLGMSQPAVSVQLKKLEELLPHPVFHKQGKRKVPSAYGRALYQSVSPVLKDIHSKVTLVNRRFSPRVHDKAIVGVEDLALTQLFGQSLLLSEMEFVTADSEQLLQKLLDERVSYALIYSDPIRLPEEVEENILNSFEWQIRVHPQWVHQKNWMSDPRWLSSTPALSSSSAAPEIDQWLKRCGLPNDEKKAVTGLSSWLAVQQMIAKGLGYGIVPSWLENSDFSVLSHSLPHLPLQKSAGQSVRVLSRKNAANHPAIQEFLERFTSDQSQYRVP